jgi:hypothetical protein
VDENTAGFGDWAASARLSSLRLLGPLLSTPFWAFRTARLSGLGPAGHRAVSPPRLASRVVRPPVLKDVLCRPGFYGNVLIQIDSVALQDLAVEIRMAERPADRLAG